MACTRSAGSECSPASGPSSCRPSSLSARCSSPRRVTPTTVGPSLRRWLPGSPRLRRCVARHRLDRRWCNRRWCNRRWCNRRWLLRDGLRRRPALPYLIDGSTGSRAHHPRNLIPHRNLVASHLARPSLHFGAVVGAKRGDHTMIVLKSHRAEKLGPRGGSLGPFQVAGFGLLCRCVDHRRGGRARR